MTMKRLIAAVPLAGLCAGVACGARAAEWECLETNSVNRLPPRTYAMPLASEQAALTDELEPDSPWKLSLNGVWKISWAGSPALREKDFWKADYDDSAWLTVDVPSCVEMRGFGSPGYTNSDYPFKLDWPFIRDRQSGNPDYNPVSSYRRTFAVPKEWDGRRVILRFDGVYSAYYVWVNGRKVGYAEDSKLPSEFDITPYLNVSNVSNLLCVEVYRWCDGSYLEDQDMTRFSGIFRDVTLWSMPKDGIWDFEVKTTPVEGYGKWRLEVKVEGDGEQRTELSLFDADRKKVADLHGSPASSTFVSTLDARAWSAEDPCLYTLVVKRGSDIRMKRIGFKEQKIVGHTMLVNGRKVKFKGVNRHETNPENGRTVSLDDMIRDVTLMKRYNIDTVRTSHYPDHHLWYDLCDRYGIYLVAEANVEAHEPGYEDRGLGRFPEWEHSIVERNVRHVKFYRNHPSVTLWSMGNETGHGDCFRHAIAAVKAIDPSRPVHWERGNPDADVDSRMYPEVGWLEKRGRFGDGLSDALDPRYPGDTMDHTKGKAFFLCEYAHAMGNALGNFAEYWDVFYRYDSLMGGCIWDWIDQAVWKDGDRVDPKTGRRERFLSYGGDYDEQPNLGPFNCNGVIDAERHVTPKLVEVGHVHRNLVVTQATRPEDGSFAVVFELWNRFSFTRADEFAAVWSLKENGLVTKRGGFDPPALAPSSRCRFTVSGLAEALAASAAGAELTVDFEFRTKRDAPWAARGWPVARDQVVLRKAERFGRDARAGAGNSCTVAEDDKTVTVTCGETKAVFCRRSGTLCELTMGGRTVLRDPAPGLVAGPRFTCGRAFTDNDIWLRGRKPDAADTFYWSGLTQLRYHARPIEVANGRVRVVTEVTGSKSAGFTHEAVWTFAEGGSVTVENTVTPHGTMPMALPRLGLSLRLDGSLEQMRWYGRGPYENYVDRCTGSFLGVYASTVSGQYVSYARPQDNGYKGDVRWVEFADKAGHGVRFSASCPLFVQALHYTAEDLEFARHRAGQQRFRAPLVPRPEVCLNLDVRQLGLGGNSCGPRPMDKYVFPIRRETWSLTIEPVDGAGGKGGGTR